jgi:hypothetical protein
MTGFSYPSENKDKKPPPSDEWVVTYEAPEAHGTMSFKSTEMAFGAMMNVRNNIENITILKLEGPTGTFTLRGGDTSDDDNSSQHQSG